MQHCPMCHKFFDFTVPVGEIVMCNNCAEKLKFTAEKVYQAFKIGSQCKGCCMLKDGKCIRVSNRTGEVGVCWMESGEGEY